jgi:hypothetical protein
VILHTRILSDGAVDDRPTQVLSYQDHAIRPYVRAANLKLYGSALDADGDGRLDFRTHAGVRVSRAREAPCQGEQPELYAPPFLVHSLADGEFSTNDQVAKDYAKTWCPALPTSIRSVEDAGCARLWASTPSMLESEKVRVAASCVEADPKKCGHPESLAPNEAFGCSLRRDAFAESPPLSLP